MQTDIPNKLDIETTEIIGELNKVKTKDLAGNMTKVQKIVKKICMENEKVVNDDLLLYIEYLKYSGWAVVKENDSDLIICINKKNLEKGIVTKPESVSRARRFLKKLGDIQYSDETENKRANYSKEYKDYFKEVVSQDNEDISLTF